MLDSLVRSRYWETQSLNTQSANALTGAFLGHSLRITCSELRHCLPRWGVAHPSSFALKRIHLGNVRPVHNPWHSGKSSTAKQISIRWKPAGNKRRWQTRRLLLHDVAANWQAIRAQKQHLPANAHTRTVVSSWEPTHGNPNSIP
jgi:hypothetical protein